MAKRFTDSEKWRNPWFRKLPEPYRWFWLYLLDECSFSGIWRVDFDQASFAVGHSLDQKEAEGVLKKHIVIIDQDKWFIPSFLKFQYGALSDSRFHQKIKKDLLKNNIDFSVLSSFLLIKDAAPPAPPAPPNGYPVDTPSTPCRHPVDSPKEQEQEQEQENVFSINTATSVPTAESQNQVFDRVTELRQFEESFAKNDDAKQFICWLNETGIQSPQLRNKAGRIISGFGGYDGFQKWLEAEIGSSEKFRSLDEPSQKRYVTVSILNAAGLRGANA